MTLRMVAIAIVAVTLGGCLQETLEPASEVGWKPRDRQLMANLPYNQAAIAEAYRRHIVEYHRREVPGSIVVDTDNRFLYYVLPKGQAIRYGIAVGEDAQVWSGIAKIGRMEEWPAWTPTPSEQARLGPLPAYVTGGPHNPMGARGMYLYSGDKDTLYRIHGTNQPEYIGTAVSSGCATSPPLLSMHTPNGLSSRRHSLAMSRYRASKILSGSKPSGNSTVCSGNSGKSAYTVGVEDMAQRFGLRPRDAAG